LSSPSNHRVFFYLASMVAFGQQSAFTEGVRGSDKEESEAAKS
jgi:hypothetical protein